MGQVWRNPGSCANILIPRSAEFNGYAGWFSHCQHYHNSFCQPSRQCRKGV